MESKVKRHKIHRANMQEREKRQKLCSKTYRPRETAFEGVIVGFLMQKFFKRKTAILCRA